MKNKQYVLGFIFSRSLQYVWLMTKNRPAWQQGLLNGIGGKVEKNETAIDAMIREAKEETGIDFDAWNFVGEMKGLNNDNTKFSVAVYYTIYDKNVTAQEDEQINVYHVNDIKNHEYVANIPLLIEACLYKIYNKSHFSSFLLNY